MRRRVGVDGGIDAGGGRDGEGGPFGDGGVTSVCRMDVKMALACSLSASDSEGMMRFEGVHGPESSIRWYDVRMSPVSRVGTNRSP